MSANKLQFSVAPGGRLHGRARVPGDKSISHRSIMLGSLADGITRVSGFLEGEDSLATLRAFRAMGVRIDGPELGTVTIQGVGMGGLQAPHAPLDLGNSGTSMRLMSGLLAGQGLDVALVGDEKTLRKGLKQLKAAARETAQRLLILLAVHAHEGLSQRELLGELEDTSITALSRNLADLSELTSRKGEGPGLVELRSDPMNLRIRRVYLTVQKIRRPSRSRQRRS